MKLTPEVAQALVNLRTSSDFATFMEWVADSSDTAVRTALRTQSNLERFQGRAQVWVDLIETVNSAVEVAQQYRESKQ